MNKFYWVVVPSIGETTIAEKYSNDEIYMIPGSQRAFDADDLIIGSEISFTKAGLLTPHSAIEDVL